MSDQKINIAIVGLGFGAEFIPIFQRHPNANMYAICQRTQSKLDEVGDEFGIEKRYTDYDELLKDPDVDAVHINTPIPNHAEQSIKALKGGQACGLHRTHGHYRRRVRRNRETGAGNRSNLHDDGNRHLRSGISVYERNVRKRRTG